MERSEWDFDLDTAEIQTAVFFSRIAIDNGRVLADDNGTFYAESLRVEIESEATDNGFDAHKAAEMARYILWLTPTA